MDIISLLKQARNQKASDIHLIAGTKPVLRIHGAIVKIDEMPSLSGEDLTQAFETITTPEMRARFQQQPELDFSFSIPEYGRYRCNAARQLGSISLVIRILPALIPPLESLRLPAVSKDLITRPRGLIIISGTTGSGKSTTLAAMIDRLNHDENILGKRIVTIEDPIEYVYQNDKCIITQRELGSDTRSFPEALKHVLRQDPDIILIGEMRDTETAAAALTIAETGHLVITTGHAPSAAGAIERIIDLFPPHERNLNQSRLATLIVGILCQTLIPRIDRAGMVPAVEVLLANPAIRNLIREGKFYQIPNIIRTHVKEGMQSLDQALLELFQSMLISRENVFALCNEREEIEQIIGKEKPPEKPSMQKLDIEDILQRKK